MKNEKIKENEKKGEKEKELNLAELDIRIAKIATTGLIEVILKFIKYGVDQEGKVTLYLDIDNEYKDFIQISQKPLIYAMCVLPKDLEALIRTKKGTKDSECEIKGYFRYNPPNQTFTLEKVEINKKIT